MAAPSITQVSTLQHCSCPQTNPIVPEIFSYFPQTQTCKPLLDSPLIGGLSCLDFRSHHFDCSLPTFLHLKTPSASLSLENTGSNPGSFQHWLSPKLSLSSCSAEDSFKNCRLDVGRPPSGDFLSASEDVPQCSTSSPIEPSYPCAARSHRLRRSGHLDLGLSTFFGFKSVFTSTSNVLT